MRNVTLRLGHNEYVASGNPANLMCWIYESGWIEIRKVPDSMRNLRIEI